MGNINKTIRKGAKSDGLGNNVESKVRDVRKKTQNQRLDRPAALQSPSKIAEDIRRNAQFINRCFDEMKKKCDKISGQCKDLKKDINNNQELIKLL